MNIIVVLKYIVNDFCFFYTNLNKKFNLDFFKVNISLKAIIRSFYLLFLL